MAHLQMPSLDSGSPFTASHSRCKLLKVRNLLAAKVEQTDIHSQTLSFVVQREQQNINQQFEQDRGRRRANGLQQSIKMQTAVVQALTHGANAKYGSMLNTVRNRP